MVNSLDEGGGPAAKVRGGLQSKGCESTLLSCSGRGSTLVRRAELLSARGTWTIFVCGVSAEAVREELN